MNVYDIFIYTHHNMQKGIQFKIDVHIYIYLHIDTCITTYLYILRATISQRDLLTQTQPQHKALNTQPTQIPTATRTDTDQGFKVVPVFDSLALRSPLCFSRFFLFGGRYGWPSNFFLNRE